jgi:hypothetical protein
MSKKTKQYCIKITIKEYRYENDFFVSEKMIEDQSMKIPNKEYILYLYKKINKFLKEFLHEYYATNGFETVGRGNSNKKTS